MAAKGARKIMAMAAMPPPPPRSSRSPLMPPKIMPHFATEASQVMAPAKVAAIELMRMSRLRTWPSSWASHAFQFVVVEQSEDTLGYGYGSVVRVASGGEGVGRIARDEVDLGHRQADFLRQALDDVVNARQIIAANGLGAISGKRNLVGEKIGNKIHDGGKDERHQHSALAAEGSPGQHEQERHGGQ